MNSLQRRGDDGPGETHVSLLPGWRAVRDGGCRFTRHLHGLRRRTLRHPRSHRCPACSSFPAGIRA